MALWEISPVMLRGHEVTNNWSVFEKMNNNEVFHAAEFGRFLLESRMVASGKERYLVHWVRRFSEYRKQLPRTNLRLL